MYIEEHVEKVEGENVQKDIAKLKKMGNK